MKQNCKHMMTNLRMHKHYLMFSVVQIIIDPEQNLKENMVIEAEIILTLAIMIDICIRIIAEREYFFKDNWNIMDLTAFVLILILISLYYVFELHLQIKTNIIEVDDSLGLILIFLRYFIQIIRIIIAIKQSHKVTQLGNVEIIQFEPIDLDNSKHQASVYIDDHNESYSFI
ncbi:unnamed protein product [Paramecium primaurelia]|uniref:Ion transport domain-containing protein n=2 Tax=Paramecium TaxID=5884 RepID=A0A8S1TXP8_9CILI|nr:unnamed protein product [Paramecium primaurelia]CAD8157068.1 unnamed protein product [Paramecium pentaurelia]